MKITFIGDIMCEPWILKKAKKKGGKYDFKEVFENVKPFFAESDYVIANLEFPLAGEEAGYTEDFYNFNAPDSFAEAVKDAGIDLVSTANNHSLDRNGEGLVRTLDVLDKVGIAHTGTFRKKEDRKEAYYFTVGDTRFAVIAYTYATNGKKGRPNADGELEGTVNLLMPPKTKIYLPGVYRKPDRIDKMFKFLGEERCGRIKIWLGKEGNYARADDNLDKERIAPCIEAFQNDIKKARENADIVIPYPHVGGQFNLEPGAISRYVIDKAVEAGADMVLAGHSHRIQKVSVNNGVICAYSLGNFSMSPGSSLMLPGALAGYSIAFHIYVEDKKIVKTAFSFLTAVETRHTQLKSYPVDALYETLQSDKERKALMDDVKTLYHTVTGKELNDETPSHEYLFSEI